jgi:cobalamin synthase
MTERPDQRRSGRGSAPALAITMFTVLPLPGRRDQVDERTAARALRWLPVVGAVVGGLAAVATLALWRGGTDGAPRLAAVLFVAVLALLTRGLHLDGLADLADGLGSRAEAEPALRIMAASDIGPFGIAALVLTLLLDAGAVGEILADSSRPSGMVSMIAAVTIGRLAAIWAAARGVPAARPGGFGALVAGSAGWTARISITGATLLAVLGCDWWAGQRLGLVRLGGACVAGLLISWLVRRHAVNRLGGMTGDVFGALIEIATTVTLVAYAGTLVWR